MAAFASFGTLPTRTRIVLWSAIGAILLMPLIAMQFTPEVNWTPGDFAVMAVLLGLPALAWDGLCGRLGKGAIRWSVAGAMLAAVLLVWAEGAVGIFF